MNLQSGPRSVDVNYIFTAMLIVVLHLRVIGRP